MKPLFKRSFYSMRLGYFTLTKRTENRTSVTWLRSFNTFCNNYSLYLVLFHSGIWWMQVHAWKYGQR